MSFFAVLFVIYIFHASLLYGFFTFTTPTTQNAIPDAISFNTPICGIAPDKSFEIWVLGGLIPPATLEDTIRQLPSDSGMWTERTASQPQSVASASQNQYYKSPYIYYKKPGEPQGINQFSINSLNTITPLSLAVEKFNPCITGNDDFMFVIGGHIAGNIGVQIDSFQVYYHANDKWIKSDNLNFGRTQCGCATTAVDIQNNIYILAVGGRNQFGAVTRVISSYKLGYSDTTSAEMELEEGINLWEDWIQTIDTSINPFISRAVAVDNVGVFVFTDQTYPLILDVFAQTISVGPSMNKVRSGGCFLWNANLNVIYAIGGVQGDGTTRNDDYEVTTVLTFIPTNSPSVTPTKLPSDTPTTIPTKIPTDETNTPTELPTNNPTIFPTNNPSVSPTQSPTLMPTETPTKKPSRAPTITPTNNPSIPPTISPSYSPSKAPTDCTRFSFYEPTWNDYTIISQTPVNQSGIILINSTNFASYIAQYSICNTTTGCEFRCTETVAACLKTEHECDAPICNYICGRLSQTASLNCFGGEIYNSVNNTVNKNVTIKCTNDQSCRELGTY